MHLFTSFVLLTLHWLTASAVYQRSSLLQFSPQPQFLEPSQLLSEQPQPNLLLSPVGSSPALPGQSPLPYQGASTAGIAGPAPPPTRPPPLVTASKLTERFNWRSLDYAFPDEKTRQVALQTGGFVPENNLPVGIEVWGDKLFITVPRWRAGIPSTLNYISLSVSYNDSPRLVPYPDWKTNIEGNCGTGITTTYRVKADACDRLWVLDSGTVGIGNTTRQVCPYSILVFDLRTDRLLRRYPLRNEDTNANTFIANIAVDIGRSCEDTFMYASDELGYGLIAYSWELNTSWRLSHGFFLPDPLQGDFNIGGLNFQWFEEGIFGMALSPIKKDGYRTLFFSPLASHREFAVSTRVLRNKELAEDTEANYHQFIALPSRGPNTHTTAQFMDDDGVLFYNLIDQNAIGCWNSRRPFTRENQGVLDRDDEGLIFPSDIKVDAQKNLWVFSDRMPIFLIANTLDFNNDINFRVYSAPVRDLIHGTVCDSNADEQLLTAAVPISIQTPAFRLRPTTLALPAPAPSTSLTPLPSLPTRSQPPPQTQYSTLVSGNGGPASYSLQWWTSGR